MNTKLTIAIALAALLTFSFQNCGRAAFFDGSEMASTHHSGDVNGGRPVSLPETNESASGAETPDPFSPKVLGFACDANKPAGNGALAKSFVGPSVSLNNIRDPVVFVRADLVKINNLTSAKDVCVSATASVGINNADGARLHFAGQMIGGQRVQLEEFNNIRGTTVIENAKVKLINNYVGPMIIIRNSVVTEMNNVMGQIILIDSVVLSMNNINRAGLVLIGTSRIP